MIFIAIYRSNGLSILKCCDSNKGLLFYLKSASSLSKTLSYGDFISEYD